ncbi:MAG: 2OG-Fe(II) oxygenase [Minwuia sp.]|uniref:2OG-Fe(II) oxygenase n=1 Tax=Minwuia sp. TaxID=2493630 RepID=UPI003A840B17
MSGHVILTPGDPAPWFQQRSYANPRYAFDTAAGRYIVLCFFGSAADPHAKAAIAAVRERPGFFCDDVASFFGVSSDPADDTQRRVADRYPGYRYFFDFDGKVSRLYGAMPKAETPGSTQVVIRRMWVVLDPTLRVMRVIPFRGDRGDIAEMLDYIETLPPPDRFAGFEISAPVLVVPNVFEPELCQKLIGLYGSNGGEDSGFVREEGGKTVGVVDHGHKSRRDYVITDQAVVAETRARIHRRLVPEVRKVHQFEANRMERYIVACYSAEDGGHFKPHRDNTTKGTAHRRFAVTINLNDGFEGGDLCFPEYGRRTYRPPPGGAVVFSCSMLHMVTKVTAGERYAFLPFLYDDAAAQIRHDNNRFLGDNIHAYRSAAAN